MADYIPTSFTDGAAPGVSASELAKIGSALQDAVRAWKTGTIANRPPANAASQYWAYFATDVAGGTLYVNFDGANWTAVASGGSPTVYTPSGASSVDLTNLDGTLDYDITIDGILAQGGAARWVALLPNGTPGTNATGLWCRGVMFRAYSDSGGTVSAPTLWVQEHGFPLCATVHTGDQNVSGTAHVRCKKGQVRMARTTFATDTIGSVAANVNEALTAHASSKWADTTTDITHLVLDFGGGTFTGTVKIKPA